jgi:transposase-like protein
MYKMSRRIESGAANRGPGWEIRRRRPALRMLLLTTGLCLACSGAMFADQGAQVAGDAVAPAATPPSLEETRLTMGKWIETQQIMSKERKDWQQGKEILVGRLELVKQEVATLEEKIAEAESSVAEADKKRNELLAENDRLKAASTQLTEAVTTMEGEVRRMFTTLPEPIQTKLQPLYQRIPEDAATTRVSAAERFQNVLGILNELNKANNEITVNYEIHNLADGKPSEVQAIYVGLAQAYYVSARGEAGIGRPSAADEGGGWKWEPSKAVAPDVLMALEILQGKHTPAFVGLPVKLQ